MHSNLLHFFPLFLWHSRQNALHLEEKERIERERLQQIIDDADDYKDELIAKRKMNREANIKKNRDQEKVIRFSLHCFSLTICLRLSIINKCCYSQYLVKPLGVHGRAGTKLALLDLKK